MYKFYQIILSIILFSNIWTKLLPQFSYVNRLRLSPNTIVASEVDGKNPIRYSGSVSFNDEKAISFNNSLTKTSCSHKQLISELFILMPITDGQGYRDLINSQIFCQESCIKKSLFDKKVHSFKLKVSYKNKEWFSELFCPAP